MIYQIQSKVDILDDSSVKQTLDIIENLLEQNLNLNITTESEVAELLDYPERFIKDKKAIEEIRNLKESDNRNDLIFTMPNEKFIESLSKFIKSPK